MRYLLDKNILSNRILKNETDRTDLFVLQEVVDEFAFSTLEAGRIKGSGINVLAVSKKHLEKLKEVLSIHGDNFSLINLYNAKGTADVVIIAYILGELEALETLFMEEYTIVTKDSALISVARSYGINCVTDLI